VSENDRLGGVTRNILVGVIRIVWKRMGRMLVGTVEWGDGVTWVGLVMSGLNGEDLETVGGVE
jgi:hypothetical protein